ncbi:thioredoxin [Trichonephila clavata]|uniref:Thioredoxin n=1 Tax=Trichonephila clavata TaxID=2740835 RepID=A0A8X6FAE4_TRICU|nr:thioredoxin [Trichonephila clavata]
MSTEQFLLAFRRFISRRGLCSTIYSDNAKTFKRAELQLKKFWKCMLYPSVQDLFSTHGITWKYIVEKGAWWGGFWERHFRTIKTCLRKIIGHSSLSSNELETVFIEIEAMINSRPITYIYDDPSEPSPLTPAHFLIGKMVHAVTSEEDFRAQLDAAGDKLVVVDFHATWCGPCKMIAPFFQELSEENTDVVFLKVDVDEVEDVALQYSVSSIPKFVFIKNKSQVMEMLGADQAKLKSLVLEHK